jgi:hypothetical protein
MLPAEGLDREFFVRLEEMDGAIARAVAAARCRHCDGPLHRADYQRKPRGALVAAAGDEFRRRHSLCCGRRGCRRRALPPSLRFLGRRVYLEVVVVLAAAFAQAMASAAAAVKAAGVPRRTLCRWLAWWPTEFPRLATWAELRARLVPPPPDEARLPASLYERLVSDVRDDGRVTEAQVQPSVVRLLARLLAPATTESVPDGSRFVGAAPATT